MKHALILAPFAEASAKRLGEKMQVTHENWLEAGRIYNRRIWAAGLRRSRCTIW